MKARKAMALAMTAAMVGGLMTVPVMAEENAELLPGGGSKIIYCITPSTSNPFFNTEQVIAKEKAEELGYEVKCASHDDDAATQLELFEAAINDGAAAIICDNAGADASIEAVQKAYDAGIPTFLIDREINQSGLAVAQIVADNAQGAAAIAEVWVEAMNYEGKYAELLGLESDTNCQVRSDNYHSVIDEYEDLEMVAQQSANWDQTHSTAWTGNSSAAGQKQSFSPIQRSPVLSAVMTQWHVVLFRLAWMQDVTTLRSSVLTDLTKQTLTSNLVTWLVPLFSRSL